MGLVCAARKHERSGRVPRVSGALGVCVGGSGFRGGVLGGGCWGRVVWGVGLGFATSRSGFGGSVNIRVFFWC